MSKKLSIGLAILLSINYSCTSPPNIPACVELTETTGWCTYTLSNEEQYVDNYTLKLDGKTWDEIKTASLIVPASSWAKLKAYIINECKRTGHCKDLATWERKISNFDGKMEKAKK